MTHETRDWNVLNLPLFSFIVTDSGGIHKVTNNESHAFVIAEYRPFDERTHILSIVLQPSSVSNSAEYTNIPSTAGSIVEIYWV